MDVVDGDIAALEQALAGPAEHWTGGAVEDESLHGIVADDLPYQRLARSEPLLCRDGQPLVDAPLGQRRLEAVELDEEGIIVGMHGCHLRQGEPVLALAHPLVPGTQALEERGNVRIRNGHAADRA